VTVKQPVLRYPARCSRSAQLRHRMLRYIGSLQRTCRPAAPPANTGSNTGTCRQRSPLSAATISSGPPPPSPRPSTAGWRSAPPRPGTRAGTAWTDHGTSRQERGLKHRADNETRTIPIPPELVRLLRAHIRRYGTTPDGRIFQTTRGGIIQDSAYSAAWAEARKAALTEAQYRSPLGRRPYHAPVPSTAIRGCASIRGRGAGAQCPRTARRGCGPAARSTRRRGSRSHCQDAACWRKRRSATQSSIRAVQGHVQVQLPGPSRRINQPPSGLPGNTR
jgi:hypothetical protein